MQAGVFQIRRGNRTALMWWLFVSIVMGLLFLSMQMYDYSQLPLRADVTVYGTTFFTLTGLHGAHVAGRVIFMVVVLGWSTGASFRRSITAVEACPLYRHFADVVWLALFTTLYIVR